MSISNWHALYKRLQCRDKNQLHDQRDNPPMDWLINAGKKNWEGLLITLSSFLWPGDNWLDNKNLMIEKWKWYNINNGKLANMCILLIRLTVGPVFLLFFSKKTPKNSLFLRTRFRGLLTLGGAVCQTIGTRSTLRVPLKSLGYKLSN